MNRAPAPARRLAWPAAAVLLALAAAGCGSPALPSGGSVPRSAATSSLSTSAVTGAGVWAVVVMGGSAADNNAFWQLFFRRAGTAQWTLVTPPGVATNGGLILAPGQGSSALAGFRPGVDLTFSPLSATTDAGAHWTATDGVLTAGLADAPDSLARTSLGDTFALTENGTVEQQPADPTRWTSLATERTLAATAAGRRCGLTTLSGVSVTPGGSPLLAGDCSRDGMAGIFTRSGGFTADGGGWRLAAPSLPRSLTERPVTVLRLTSIPGGNAALLATAGSLIGAWSTDGGSHWILSGPLPTGPAAIRSAAFGTRGAISVVLSDGRAATIRPGTGGWSQLPGLPDRTATLAVGPADSVDALAVSGSTLTVWRLSGPASGWHRVQVIKVPVEYGSSG